MLSDARGEMQHNVVGYIDTMLAYYLPGLETSQLTDEQWAEKLAQLNDIRKKEMPKA